MQVKWLLSTVDSKHKRSLHFYQSIAKYIFVNTALLLQPNYNQDQFHIIIKAKKSCLVVLHHPPVIFENWKKFYYTKLYRT